MVNLIKAIAEEPHRIILFHRELITFDFDFPKLRKVLISMIFETDKLFQARESPAHLNIPTPTPAPDHLLGGHNELGGTIVE